MARIIASNTYRVLRFEIFWRNELMKSGRGNHWGVAKLKTEGRLEFEGRLAAAKEWQEEIGITE